MNKKMNRLLWMLVALLSLAACTEDTEYTAGVWYRRSDFDGVARMDAAGFTIGKRTTSTSAAVQEEKILKAA